LKFRKTSLIHAAVLTQYWHVMDKHIDKLTLGDSIYHARIVSRGENL